MREPAAAPVSPAAVHRTNRRRVIGATQAIPRLQQGHTYTIAIRVGSHIAIVFPLAHPAVIVIPTEAKRSGEICCYLAAATGTLFPIP
jgi:hypothetical protein